MLKHQQPETIDDYTAQLRKRLAGVLPPEKIEEIATETELHLADKTEEMMRNASVYERQAVAQFVPVHRYAGALNRAWSATYLRHRGTRVLQNISLGISSISISVILANILANNKLPLFLKIPFEHQYGILAVFTVICVFLLAIFSCRHQLKRMIIFGIVTTVCFFVSYGYFCINEDNYRTTLSYSGTISRISAGIKYKEQYNSYIKNRNKILKLNTGIHWAKTSLQKLEDQLKSTDDMRGLDKKKWLMTIASIRQEMPTFMQDKENIILPQTYGDFHEIADIRTSAKETVGYEFSFQQKYVPVLQSLPLRNVNVQNVDAANWSEKDGLLYIKTKDYMTKYAPVCTVKNDEMGLMYALKQWDYGHEITDTLYNQQKWKTQNMNTILAFIARPKGSFDWNIARSAGVNSLQLSGAILLADLVGGWIGMAILRGSRRIRNNKNQRDDRFQTN
jgi:hypothetical protein